METLRGSGLPLGGPTQRNDRAALHPVAADFAAEDFEIRRIDTVEPAGAPDIPDLPFVEGGRLPPCWTLKILSGAIRLHDKQSRLRDIGR